QITSPCPPGSETSGADVGVPSGLRNVRTTASASTAIVVSLAAAAIGLRGVPTETVAPQSGARHPQVPELHSMRPPHARPQAPQWAASLAGRTQASTDAQ